MYTCTTSLADVATRINVESRIKPVSRSGSSIHPYGRTLPVRPDQIHNASFKATGALGMPLHRMSPSKLIYIRHDCSVSVFRNTFASSRRYRRVCQTQFQRRNSRLLLHKMRRSPNAPVRLQGRHSGGKRQYQVRLSRWSHQGNDAERSAYMDQVSYRRYSRKRCSLRGRAAWWKLQMILSLDGKLCRIPDNRRLDS